MTCTLLTGWTVCVSKILSALKCFLAIVFVHDMYTVNPRNTSERERLPLWGTNTSPWFLKQELLSTGQLQPSTFWIKTGHSAKGVFLVTDPMDGTV